MHAISELTPMGDGIIRLRAANPSPMTASGTNTYLLLGQQSAVVIDPGPDLDSHFSAIRKALGPLRLEAILVTHAHLDHTALAPRLAAATGAPIMAYGPVEAGRSALMQRLALAGLTAGGEGLDHNFTPDLRLSDGQILTLAGAQIEVLHTPGHLSGHLSFAVRDRLFSGDHVMGWSSSLISPPDGDMGAYMASLAALSQRQWHQFLPGHGEEIADPALRLATLIAHRLDREASVLRALQDGPATAAALAARIYTDTPPPLLAAASRNVLAHLIDLTNRNIALPLEDIAATARFKLI